MKPRRPPATGAFRCPLRPQQVKHNRGAGRLNGSFLGPFHMRAAEARDFVSAGPKSGYTVTRQHGTVARMMEDAGGLVTIAEAARLLTAAGDVVERSTLSRYLDEYAEALPKQRIPGQRGTFVDLAALGRHRADNIRLALTDDVRSVLAAGLSAASGAPAPLPRPSRPAPVRDTLAPGQSAAQARKLNAEAEKREIELAVLKRELVPVTAIARAAEAAVGDMTSAFEASLSHQSDVVASRLGCTKAEARSVLRDSLAEFRRHLAHSWRVQITALVTPQGEEPAAPAS